MAKKISILSKAALENAFGKFGYSNTGGGRIEIESGWVAQNIADCVLKKANKGKDVKTQCHRLAKEPIERAFRMVADQGLSKLIKTYDGLWVPRHQLWKNSKPLSRHSWGVAFDLNAEWNSYGNGISPENLALNEVFNRFGFAWGGDWSPAERDAMHWELADLDAWKQVPQDADKDLILAIWRQKQWSYHRLQSARLEGGSFLVDRGEVAALFNKTTSAGTAPIRSLLTELGQKPVKTSDLLNDPQDPRLYLFVKPGV
jgi:hypothetical protein